MSLDSNVMVVPSPLLNWPWTAVYRHPYVFRDASNSQALISKPSVCLITGATSAQGSLSPPLPPCLGHV